MKNIPVNTTVFEFIKLNPGLTLGEISSGMGKRRKNIAGTLSQLYTTGRVIKSGFRNNENTYSVNSLPFGCSNHTLMKFNQLLNEVRRNAA